MENLRYNKGRNWSLLVLVESRTQNAGAAYVMNIRKEQVDSGFFRMGRAPRCDRNGNRQL